MNQSLGCNLNLELICWFCLNGEPTDLISMSKPMNVYCSTNHAIELEHIILTCIGIRVRKDELPTWICKECISQLTKNYTFREKCLETMKYLTDMLIERESSNQTESSIKLQNATLTNSNDDTQFQTVKQEPNKSTQVKEKFTNSEWRSSHFHRMKSPFKCDICGSLLKSRRTLIYHIRTLHISSNDLSEKQLETTKAKPPVIPGDNDTLFPFKCDICGSGLKSMDSTREHMLKIHIDGNYFKRNVSVDNPLECEICQNGYPNRKSLSRHRIRVHGVFRGHNKAIRSDESKTKSKVKRWQICPVCGVMRKDMKCHIATHDTDRLFKCEICGSDLKTAVNLKRHLRRVHTEDRKYPCDICNVAFKAPFQLKRHNRKHTQERNYACTFCEKRFIDKATLERHFVVHFGERNIECKFCGKRFQSNLGLQNHVGIHTLEKKFKCGLCALAFITSSAASVHRRSHRNKLDNKFHCGDCSMKFQEVIMLKMHLRAVSHQFSVEKS